MKTIESMYKIACNYQWIHFVSSKVLRLLIKQIEKMDIYTFISNSDPDHWSTKEAAIVDIKQELEERSWIM
jgi:hypothetical protein